MKPTDKVLYSRANKSAGCNASEPICSLVSKQVVTAEPVHVGRRQNSQAIAANYACERHRGIRDDTLRKCNGVTRETLSRQLSSFDGELKTESYKAVPKWTRGEKGVGAVHSSDNQWDNITHCSKGTALQPCLHCRTGRLIALTGLRLLTDRVMFDFYKCRLCFGSKSEMTKSPKRMVVGKPYERKSHVRFDEGELE